MLGFDVLANTRFQVDMVVFHLLKFMWLGEEIGFSDFLHVIDFLV